MAATNNQDVIVVGDDLRAILQEFEDEGLPFTQLAADVQEELEEFVHVNPPAENNTSVNTPAAIGAGVDATQAAASAVPALATSVNTPVAIGAGVDAMQASTSTVPAITSRKIKKAPSKPFGALLRQTLEKSNKPPKTEIEDQTEALRSTVQRIKDEIANNERQLVEELALNDSLQAAQVIDEQKLKQLDDERKRVKETKTRRKRQLDDCKKRIDTLRVTSTQKRCKLTEEKERIISFFEL